MGIESQNGNEADNISNEYESSGVENLRQSYWIDNKNFLITGKQIGTDYNYKHELVWKNVIGFIILHCLALWGFVIALTGEIKFGTYLWSK